MIFRGGVVRRSGHLGVWPVFREFFSGFLDLLVLGGDYLTLFD